jgi:hypothetical protein
MEIKKCSKCKKIKPLEDFYKNKSDSSGYGAYCKECSKTYHKDNRERRNNQSKEWYKNNYKHRKEYRKTNFVKYRENLKRWRLKNLEKARAYINKYNSKKYKENPYFKLNHNISTAINKTLKRNKGGYHWETLVNYTSEELKKHIERQFKPGMSWSNYGKWHIDHIIPISYFEFNSPYDDEFQICWSLNNLKPLWSKENISKNNKIRFENEAEYKKVSNEIINYIKIIVKQAKGLRLGWLRLKELE